MAYVSHYTAHTVTSCLTFNLKTINKNAGGIQEERIRDSVRLRRIVSLILYPEFCILCSLMEMLRTDFKNMLRDGVGRHGLSPAELQRLGRRAQRCLTELKEERAKGRCPFLDLPYQKETAGEIKSIDRELRSWVKDFVVLGIGGSALGNIALHQALNPPYPDKQAVPRVHIIDTIDPDLFDGLLKSLDLRHTVFNVISKSGTTVETVAQFLIVREMLKNVLGDTYPRHIITITDPEDGALRRLDRKS